MPSDRIDLPDEIKKKFFDRLEELFVKAEEIFCRKFVRCHLLFDLRGRCAGMAHYGYSFELDPTSGEKRQYYGTIDLNRECCLYEFKDMLEDTLPHELAHLIVKQLYKRSVKPHGVEWSAVAQILGCSGNRCHRYALARSGGRYRHAKAIKMERIVEIEERIEVLEKGEEDASQ